MMSALFCQSCVYAVHPAMLTGYCIEDAPCARCGRRNHVAIVVCGKADGDVRLCHREPLHAGPHERRREP